MDYRKFSKEEFMDKFDPYEYAHEFSGNPVKLEYVLKDLAKQAKEFGIVGIKGIYNAYVRGLKQRKAVDGDFAGNITNFTGCDFELATGDWIADDTGIYKVNKFGDEEYACNHPITIKERLRNIDTGVVKLKLSYSENYKWKDIVVSKSILASSNKIVELSDRGVGVTTENSKTLVKYLYDLERHNYAEIPEKRCCSRLGWIDDEGFAPYCNQIEYDGDVNLAHIFKAVKSNGSFDAWKNEILAVCSYNYVNKIVMAASFTAPLIKILGINNFFLHLWADTETAKTVSMICAASVYANPRIGRYIQTFNSTNVGKEKMAEIANSLPVFFDELEIATDRLSFDREIYELSEGAGRLRGNKLGGTDKTGTWQTCFITTGEKPIISENSKGGAVNRIIELHCTKKLIENGKETCDVIYNNYGMAGPIYIRHVERKKHLINDIYKNNYKMLESSLKTEKQTSIGAALITAFNLASGVLFEGKLTLTVDEVAKFLTAKETMSVHGRAYEYLLDFISQNSNRFRTTDNNGLVYGKVDGDVCYINKSVFNKMCDEAGFNPTAFLHWLNNNGKLAKRSKDHFTISSRINGMKTRCVALVFDEESIPF